MSDNYIRYVYCETCGVFLTSPPVVPEEHERAYNHHIERDKTMIAKGGEIERV